YGTSGYVYTDDYYYDVDEGYELLESVGMTTADINFTVTCQEGADTMFVALQNQLSKVGIEFDIEIIEAAANFTLLMNGDWTATVGSNAYTNAAPYVPWTFILKKDAMLKQIWTDIYNPELFEEMLVEYDAMTTAATWDEMLEHCHALTKMAQDDHAALLGLQRPGFIILNGEYKNAIYYTATQYLMLYYLYV
ncbi:MAG: hypothetical protein IKM51_04425, partial [Oscillospiraceae bacterium]|nr:hypothetical protein [Oscillospiraceae bacterium]